MQFNRKIIFKIDKGTVIAHSYEHQRTYKLNEQYFERLKEWSIHPPLSLTDMDQNLKNSGLICEESPTEWEGDDFSEISYYLTKIKKNHNPVKDEAKVAEDLLNLSNAVGKVPESAYENFNFLKKVDLPSPNVTPLKKATFFDTVKNRFTCRQFSGQSLDIEILSTILHMTFGYIHGKEWSDLIENGFLPNGIRKANPSTSGTNTFEAVLAVVNVVGLENGFYWYNPSDHSLNMMKMGLDDATLSHIVCDQYWVSGISCGLFLVADMRRVWMKDKKTRGFVTTYLDAGHISQNILLTCTALGLNTWMTGTFQDEDISDLIIPLKEKLFPSFFVGFGYGEPTGVPRNITI